MLKAKDFEDAYFKLISNKNITNNIIRSNTYESINLNNNETYIEPMASEIMMRDFCGYMPDDVLVKVDRASMAVSLESRAPFLDKRIIEFALSLPFDLKIKNNKSKWILRKILQKHIPDNLIERPKTGFGIPLARWLREDLKVFSENLLCKEDINRHGIFDYEIVSRLWNRHMLGEDFSNELWPIIVFQRWIKTNHPEL